MYSDVRQKTSLSAEEVEKFVKENDDFFKDLDKSIENISANEALDVISLLISAKKYFISNLKWENLIFTCLVKIKEGIYNKKFNTISSFTGITYVAYIIRELSNEIYSLQRFLGTLESFQSRLLDQYLCLPENSGFYAQNGFELIQGMSGVLKYYLDSERRDIDGIINEIVSLFIKHSEPKMIMGHEAPIFHYYPSEYEKKYMKDEAPNGYVNYSVSHGMAGPLTALSLVSKKTTETNKIMKITDSIIDEYMRSYYYIDNIVFWPGRITFEQYISPEKYAYEKRRMSWCYGSIGILCSLYVAAKEKDNVKLQEFCTAEFKKIASLGTKEYLLDSPIVCHGLAGLVPVFRMMCRETCDPVFQSKVDDILGKLIFNFAYRKTENTKFTGMNRIKEYNYLEGYTGILQTIYSAINETINVNEKRLLIC